LAESLIISQTLWRWRPGRRVDQPLDEATSVANDLKNESIRQRLLNTRGDAAYIAETIRPPAVPTNKLPKPPAKQKIAKKP